MLTLAVCTPLPPSLPLDTYHLWLRQKFTARNFFVKLLMARADLGRLAELHSRLTQTVTDMQVQVHIIMNAAHWILRVAVSCWHLPMVCCCSKAAVAGTRKLVQYL